MLAPTPARAPLTFDRPGPLRNAHAENYDRGVARARGFRQGGRVGGAFNPVQAVRSPAARTTLPLRRHARARARVSLLLQPPAAHVRTICPMCARRRRATTTAGAGAGPARACSPSGPSTATSSRRHARRARAVPVVEEPARAAVAHIGPCASSTHGVRTRSAHACRSSVCLAVRVSALHELCQLGCFRICAKFRKSYVTDVLSRCELPLFYTTRHHYKACSEKITTSHLVQNLVVLLQG